MQKLNENLFKSLNKKLGVRKSSNKNTNQRRPCLNACKLDAVSAQLWKNIYIRTFVIPTNQPLATK